MEARGLIEGASFGPDIVKTMGQALDEVWVDIGSKFGTDATVVHNARVRLATLRVAPRHYL
jgi:hypothetical protein